MWFLVMMVASVLLSLMLGLFCVMLLFSILYIAHVGYLHLVSTSLRCSVLSSPGVEQTALSLCASVLMTQYLAAIW